jgi:hypothetical protein
VNTGAPWPGLVEAERRVRKMQAKLHQWATADPDRRFDDLHNLVYDPAFLVVAWSRVRTNKGARTAGVDGVAPRAVGAGAGKLLGQVRADLKAGRLVPQRVREKAIPKASGKLRRLGIATTADRVVQASLKLVLEPIFEADFHPCSLSVAGSPVNRGCACWSRSLVDGWTRRTESGSRRSARSEARTNGLDAGEGRRRIRQRRASGSVVGVTSQQLGWGEGGTARGRPA